MACGSIRRTICFLTLAFALAAPLAAVPARAEEDFSFYGVRFGMRKAEIAALWSEVGENTFTPPSSPISQVAVAYDHENRLYEMTVTIDLRILSEPPALVAQAFQQEAETRWGRHPAVAYSLSMKREGAGITLWDKKMREAYLSHLQRRIASFLKP